MSARSANDLPKGATETADITVFYATPTLEQLDVKNVGDAPRARRAERCARCAVP